MNTYTVSLHSHFKANDDFWEEGDVPDSDIAYSYSEQVKADRFEITDKMSETYGDVSEGIRHVTKVRTMAVFFYTGDELVAYYPLSLKPTVVKETDDD